MPGYMHFKLKLICARLYQIRYYCYGDIYLAQYMLWVYCRVRQAGKKKKKIPIHIKRPGAKKDEKKVALKRLKDLLQEDYPDRGAASESGSEGEASTHAS